MSFFLGMRVSQKVTATNGTFMWSQRYILKVGIDPSARQQSQGARLLVVAIFPWTTFTRKHSLRRRSQPGVTTLTQEYHLKKITLLEVLGVPDGRRQEMQGDAVDAPWHLKTWRPFRDTLMGCYDTWRSQERFPQSATSKKVLWEPPIMISTTSISRSSSSP